MTASRPKKLQTGILQPEITSFRLHLKACGKADKTVSTYTEARAGSPPPTFWSKPAARGGNR
jgi:hypothetical protein